MLDWQRPPDAPAVGRMVSALAHRGPDADGLLQRGPIVLGHRRLSVIDVDERSNQPLADVSGQVFIVYNGEIYNYRELRLELGRAGASFHTESDTEVIVEAYKRWEVGCLERLNGMFAFALWDERQQRLLLARDRLGEKPLYYQALADGGLLFASELRALRRHPQASRQIDARAIAHFLSLNYTLTGTCIAAGVDKLPSAHYLLVERERPLRPRCYWDLASRFLDKPRYRSRAAAGEELGALIDDAVRRRMISDVPLGAFLSGGVDSSIVVEAMTRAAGQERVKTFTIGFEEETFSEVPQARQVAAVLGVEHHVEVVSADVGEQLPRIMLAADEPFADTSQIPMYFLARFARQAVTVCLSGDGGDEIFAGYETYSADRLHARLRRLPRSLTAGLERLVGLVLPVRFAKVSFDYKLRQFLSGLPLSRERAHHHWRTILSAAEKKRLLRPEHRALASDDGFATFAAHFAAVADCAALDQAMYVDIKTWLADDILTKVDRATMAHSLESRAPLLDHRLVELAASFPVSWKMKGGRKKFLLKESRRQLLPAAVLRRRKSGFNAPISQWLSQGFGDLAEQVLSTSPLNEWLEPNAVAALWREHRQHVKDHGLKLFGLVCLGLWLKEAALD